MCRGLSKMCWRYVYSKSPTHMIHTQQVHNITLRCIYYPYRMLNRGARYRTFGCKRPFAPKTASHPPPGGAVLRALAGLLGPFSGAGRCASLPGRANPHRAVEIGCIGRKTSDCSASGRPLAEAQTRPVSEPQICATIRRSGALTGSHQPHSQHRRA